MYLAPIPPDVVARPTVCVSALTTTPDDESIEEDESASPIQEKNDDEWINTTNGGSI
jgi:hypothetical protein